jgi:hypothetical protein
MQPSQIGLLRKASETHDDPTLRHILYEALGDVPLLLNTVAYLAYLSAEYPWLGPFLADVGDLWFLSFKRTQPRELVCAFEYDYFVRESEPSWEQSATLGLLGSVVDEALLVNYCGLYGISKRRDTATYGAELFLLMRPYERVETLLRGGETGEMAFDDALLNPPLARVGEWTVFHVKMRRIAFRVLKEVMLISDLYLSQRGEGLMPPLFKALFLYALHLKTQIWHSAANELVFLSDVRADVGRRDTLTDRMHQFFMPPQEFEASLREAALGHTFLLSGGEEAQQEWRRIIVKQVALVESGMPYPNETLFTAMLRDSSADTDHTLRVGDNGLYDFIYRSSPEAQEAFQARVAYPWEQQ